MSLKTGAEYRHQNKVRVQAHRKNMEERGYRAKTVFLSDKFHEILKQVCKEERLPQHEAFDLILDGYLKSLDSQSGSVNGSVSANVNDIVLEEKPITPPHKYPNHQQNLLFDEDKDSLPDCHGQTLTVAERDKFLLTVERMFPGKGKNKLRAEALNDADIKTGRGKEWNPKLVADNLAHAKKRTKSRS